MPFQLVSNEEAAMASSQSSVSLLGSEFGRKDDLAECNSIQSGREVSLDTSQMPSSSTLVVAESVSRTPIPLYQTRWRDILKSIIFVRLSTLTRCGISPPSHSSSQVDSVVEVCVMSEYGVCLQLGNQKSVLWTHCRIQCSLTDGCHILFQYTYHFFHLCTHQ